MNEIQIRESGKITQGANRQTFVTDLQPDGYTYHLTEFGTFSGSELVADYSVLIRFVPNPHTYGGPTYLSSELQLEHLVRAFRFGRSRECRVDVWHDGQWFSGLNGRDTITALAGQASRKHDRLRLT